MVRAEKGIITAMEVDSIVVKVTIENIQVAPDTTQIATKTMQPPTLSTITKTK
jgi:hypothetical protein